MAKSYGAVREDRRLDHHSPSLGRRGQVRTNWLQSQGYSDSPQHVQHSQAKSASSSRRLSSSLLLALGEAAQRALALAEVGDSADKQHHDGNGTSDEDTAELDVTLETPPMSPDAAENTGTVTSPYTKELEEEVQKQLERKQLEGKAFCDPKPMIVFNRRARFSKSQSILHVH